MPGIPAARRRKFNTRGRGNSTPRQRAFEEHESMSEPPRKRRKYVPGGIGGGGRFVENQGIEMPGSATSRREGRGLRNLQNAATPARPERPRRERRQTQHEQIIRPRYSSAAAAAAAVVQGDGFKPREERGWEEFHEHLDIDLQLSVFGSGLVDGTIQFDDDSASQDEAARDVREVDAPEGSQSLLKRPARPQRSQSAMLRALGNPDTPKAVPVPGPNPREKLTLPRPSFRLVDPFISYEKNNGSIDYVDKAMANVGYQESDHFERPPKGLVRLSEDNVDEEPDTVATAIPESATEANLLRVEYDMDEQDQKWLDTHNAWRKSEGVEAIKPAMFEITMTKIEKEWHALEKRIPKPNPKPPQTHRPRSSSAAAVNGEPVPEDGEQDTKCAICDDGDCENTNAIVFCDGCDLAVHQECYGVPFIPEGQWLCRKCHLIGRGTPTCVFCPGTDGAFKQTNSARWAHLLCAIWIPEVSLGNMTFMEPVMDVEKVPKSRWRLTCDICKQKMGACIQCGHKNCYTAFHVTCARRARWYVSMKSSHGGPANLDSAVLRAYCGNHVTEEWAETYNTYRATISARKYFKKAMRGKIWADSHQAAQHVPVLPTPEPVAVHEEVIPKITLTIGGNKKKKDITPGKPVWKLPSGAPVIPASLYNAVDLSLQRFALRKRRDFAAEMCRYWTLKREAKRGAALIKRLQLQMETFSSMEITRRNFAGMGAIGGVRLQRRIDFAEDRIRELDHLVELCSLLKERESVKLQDAEILRDVVNTTYFPIPPLLWQAMGKVEHLDSKKTFTAAVSRIREKLEQRGYASVTPFSTDLTAAFAQVLSNPIASTGLELAQNGDEGIDKKDLTADEKTKRALAKRLLRAVHPILQDAMHKESQLNREEMAEFLDIDQLVEKTLSTRHLSEASVQLAIKAVASQHNEGDSDTVVRMPVPIVEEDAMDIDTIESNVAPIDGVPTTSGVISISKPASPQNHLTPMSTGAAHPDEDELPIVVPRTTEHDNTTASDTLQAQQVPTPPLSTNPSHNHAQQIVIPGHVPERATQLSLGGAPWYMEQFEPSGLTLHDDKSDGRAVGDDEDLSDIDEAAMDGLAQEVGDVMGNHVEVDVTAESPRNATRGARGGRGKVRGGKRGRGGRGKGRWSK